MASEYNIEYRKYKDNMKARMMNITAKSEEVLQHQEQQLSNNDDTENIDLKSNINDNWSAGSERTCEKESTDIEENEQAITKIQVIY